MARTTIPAELVAINAIQGTLIADNAITAVHIATNAVSGTLVADNAITSTHIAQNNVTATQIAQNTITVTQLADSAVETAKINDSAVTTAKINNAAVTEGKLAANSVTSAKIVNGTIVTADLANNAVTIDKMASLARGKIIYGDSAGDPAALAVGSNGQVLTTDGTDISWGTVSGGVDGISSSADANAITIDSSERVGIGTSSPSGKFHIEGGRGGIISTDSSWGQFRVANSAVEEVGITVLNGATNSEFLSDTDPSSSNKFIMGISPYGAGTDTWGIGHGNLGDSVMHIDGSGNFGFGVNTDNPLTFFEISKSRPNVNAPADYELKLTLNTYGYVGSGYKLGMIQFVGGDTASAQDNFYAGISAKAWNGANNQEDGALQFHVESDEDTDTLAVEIIGENDPSNQIAGAGSVRNGMLFQWQGIAIDRSWADYPGIAVMNSSAYSTTASTQAEFRVHGTNGSNTSYPQTSGSDFSVDFRVDGSYQSGSDRRRKKNITTIDNALSTVKQLTGKKFQIINRADEVQETVSKNGYKFGLIAQEVENIIPETVKYNANEDDGTENWNSSYSIDYPSLTALLVNAIKEQDTVIQDLKSRIETLEG